MTINQSKTQSMSTSTTQEKVLNSSWKTNSNHFWWTILFSFSLIRSILLQLTRQFWKSSQRFLWGKSCSISSISDLTCIKVCIKDRFRWCCFIRLEYRWIIMWGFWIWIRSSLIWENWRLSLCRWFCNNLMAIRLIITIWWKL